MSYKSSVSIATNNESNHQTWVRTMGGWSVRVGGVSNNGWVECQTMGGWSVKQWVDAVSNNG